MRIRRNAGHDASVGCAQSGRTNERTLMATVFIASGPMDGRWFPLKKKSLVFGRDEGLLAQIPDSGISRKHFAIHYDEAKDRYVAVDLSSKNGVYINNKKVEGETPLQGDDLIRIGETLLLFVGQDFDGDDNALRFYRKQGERFKPTEKLEKDSVHDALEKLKKNEPPKHK